MKHDRDDRFCSPLKRNLIFPNQLLEERNVKCVKHAKAKEDSERACQVPLLPRLFLYPLSKNNVGRVISHWVGELSFHDLVFLLLSS